jgi:hypothetical protein
MPIVPLPQFEADLAEYLQDRQLRTAQTRDIQTERGRQDRTQNVFDRFENPDQVKRSLHTAGYYFRAFAPFEV